MTLYEMWNATAKVKLNLFDDFATLISLILSISKWMASMINFVALLDNTISIKICNS